jgi:hypothetical protein
MTRFDLRRTASFGLVAACLALTACGSTTNLKVEESTRITKGQELTDLLKARELGALSDSEYQALRARIMRRSQ